MHAQGPAREHNYLASVGGVRENSVMASFADKPLMPFTTVEEWDAYLSNDPNPDGVRIKIRKKGAVDPGLTRLEALEVALCHGWIDGQGSSYDEQFSLQSYTPRRRASPWSTINVEHVERLIAEGRMNPAGHAEIERAKADGRWDAAYRQKDAPVPPDFQVALDGNPKAAAEFATVTGSARFAFLFRLGNLKRPESRARKIIEYIEILERGERLR